MQDLTTKPKYLPAGSLRGSGWDSFYSSPSLPIFKLNAYRGSGFDYGDRIPRAPAIGRTDTAMTAERLHNAQISEGLGAGPNRMTLGKSYDSDGLSGGFFDSLFKAAVQRSLPNLERTGMAIGTSALTAVGQYAFSKFVVPARSDIASNFPLVASAADTFNKAQAQAKTRQAPFPSINGAPLTGRQTPSQVAPGPQPFQPNNQPPVQVSYFGPSGGAGYSAYAGSSADTSAPQPGFFSKIPSWTLPLGAGLLFLMFSMKKGSKGPDLARSLSSRGRR